VDIDDADQKNQNGMKIKVEGQPKKTDENDVKETTHTNASMRCCLKGQHRGLILDLEMAR
jgi:ribosomal protein S14